ncbi:flavin reductase family protein [Streptomyces daliensis]|uniref:Flavin reductase family protein n=1 Tax=Streptomyces daliensis TaxID=299421 RepID=A0A8T4IHN9_9ACTN|nr:flavin reductase family protein [Streptomyces daliensis]
MERPALAPPVVLAKGQVSARQFRDAFAQLPAGVSVLTTYAPEGPCGMTASAVCSLSQDPPLALAALANDSRTLARIRVHGAFGINVLRARDTAVADLFARPAPDPAHRFDGLPHEPVASVPVLCEALVWLACEVVGLYPGGDHTILTGLVRAAGRRPGVPLVWHRRRYTSPA